jgi:hypothetical protein
LGAAAAAVATAAAAAEVVSSKAQVRQPHQSLQQQQAIAPQLVVRHIQVLQQLQRPNACQAAAVEAIDVLAAAYCSQPWT